MKAPTAIELLISELERSKQMQAEQWDEWNRRIKELEASIFLLSGKPASELPAEKFDDENPDYIKGTEDGI